MIKQNGFNILSELVAQNQLIGRAKKISTNVGSDHGRALHRNFHQLTKKAPGERGHNVTLVISEPNICMSYVERFRRMERSIPLSGSQIIVVGNLNDRAKIQPS